MSGPKISIYDLTGWARKVVEGQISCEQQGLVCAEQIETILRECLGMRGELNKSLQLLDIFQKRCGGQEQTIDEINKLMNSLEQAVMDIKADLNRNRMTVSAKYSISDEALEEKKQALAKVQAVKDKALELQKKMQDAANAGKNAGAKEQKNANQKIADLINDPEKEPVNPLEGRDLSTLEQSISEDISGAFSFEFVDDTAEEKSFEQAKKELFDEMAELLKMDLPKELIDEIRNGITNLEKITEMGKLTSFDSISVQKIFKDIEAYQIECEKAEAEFTEAVLRYKTLCDMAGLESEKNRQFKYAAELEEAIHEVEMALIKQKEQAYIADCVDEVMQDMGYDLIGRREVTKKSGKQFKNELYQFGEGTAVNITYSSEGQISMELGGIAREDRVPTDDETSVLTEDMQTFCGQFAEFEKRMKEKGVIVGNRIAMMPPEAEYAAIINVSDYEVAEGKQIAEMDVTKKSRTQTAATQQVLRRDD